MTQPTIKVLQIDQDELTAFVDVIVGSPVSAGASSLDQLSDVTIDEPGNGEHLVYNGAQWVNSLDLGFVVGDGLDSDAFDGSPRTIAVDSTVVRTNATNSLAQTNTFTASVSGISAGGVVLTSAAPGYILDDTGAAADESIWRMYSSSGQLIFDTRNDANSVSVNWLTVDRTGTAIDAINFSGNVLVGSPSRYVVEGHATSKSVLRSIRFVVGPGSVAGTNLDVLLVDTADGSYNIPNVDNADNMPVDSSDGSWQLDATGEGLRLILPHQVIGIINCNVTLAVWNGASTTVQYYITPEIWSGAGSPSNENGIQFLAFAQGSNSASSWPGTVTNTISDQVRIQLSFMTSS